MPLVIYRKLNLRESKETTISLWWVDISIKHAQWVVENMLIKTKNSTTSLATRCVLIGFVSGDIILGWKTNNKISVYIFHPSNQPSSRSVKGLIVKTQMIMTIIDTKRTWWTDENYYGSVCNFKVWGAKDESGSVCK